LGGLIKSVSQSNLTNQFEGLREAIAGNIAKSVYGESGMITQGDIDRIAETLPSLYEAEKSATEKYTRLMSNIESAMADVSGGVPSYGAFQGGGYAQDYSPVGQVTAGDGGQQEEIPVMHLESNQAGWVTPDMFDPSVYRKL